MKSETRPLLGKIALVTGGNRGIGKAIALKMARAGAHVFLHYASNLNAAVETQGQIMSHGGSATLLRSDFRDETSIERLFDDLDLELSKMSNQPLIDILVSNAAIAPAAKIEETTSELFDEIFKVNVKAPFFIAQKTIPRLRDGGRIIQLSSLVTRIGYPREAAYSMSKGAIDVLTRLLAKQLGDRAITVNTLSPGVIDTDMNADLLRDPSARKYVESISALGRVGTVEDVADVAVFLASDEARWITGQYVDVSGGSFLG